MRRRWSRRASWCAAIVVAVAFLPGCASRQFHHVTCELDDPSMVLAAQAVPTASLLPCIEDFPVGWIFGGSGISNGLSSFWLDSDRAGLQAVRVSLTETCDVSEAVEVTPGQDEAGTRRFEEPISLRPRFVANRYYVFEGGCVKYRFAFNPRVEPALAVDIDEALSFRSRLLFVDRMRETVGLELCGFGASPCPG
ncbi:MAG: hypothetical protein ACRDHC_08235 [Actinomycetota bacterium]